MVCSNYRQSSQDKKKLSPKKSTNPTKTAGKPDIPASAFIFLIQKEKNQSRNQYPHEKQNPVNRDSVLFVEIRKQNSSFK